MIPRRTDARRPTPLQERLLEAILLSGDAALEAWREWRRQVDLDRLDPASFQVVPQLYQKLGDEVLENPWKDRLKGIYRMAWAKNQWLLARCRPALQALLAEDIPVLILKGAALNALHGSRHGIRLIGDVDVMVPVSDAERSVRVLTEAGWVPRTSQDISAEYVTVSKGEAFDRADGGALDLHWHLFPEDLVPEHEAAVWSHAVPVDLVGLDVRVPSPTEMLLHVCVHGWAWCPHPPFRWITDAMAVLGSRDPAIDWQRLVAAARRRHLVRRLEAALTYLDDRFGAGIPVSVLDALAVTEVSALERWENWARTRPAGVFGRTIEKCAIVDRLRGNPDSATPSGFFDYLRRRRGLSRVRDLPLHMIAHLVHEGRP